MLTVVTHTRHYRPELLKQCQASVEAALPSGARHVVIPCFDDFARKRLDAIELDDYVAFVDDDDTIHPNALNWCMEAALMYPDSGLIITDEVRTDEFGNTLAISTGTKTYTGMSLHPRVAHQLAMFKGGSVDACCYDMHKEFTVGIDWFMKSSSARVYGAVHVPRPAYNWRTYSGETMNSKEHATFFKNMPAMGNKIRSTWPRADGRVPVFEPQY